MVDSDLSIFLFFAPFSMSIRVSILSQYINILPMIMAMIFGRNNLFVVVLFLRSFRDESRSDAWYLRYDDWQGECMKVHEPVHCCVQSVVIVWPGALNSSIYGNCCLIDINHVKLPFCGQLTVDSRARGMQFIFGTT